MKVDEMPVILSANADDLLKDFLLLNTSCGSVGLMHGKTGIVLALFELARFQQSEQLEEQAFELLQQVLVYKGKNLSFSNGYAGIGFVLLYLIQHKFVEANFRELFFRQHQGILAGILTGRYECHRLIDCAELLLYLNASRVYTSGSDFKKIEYILSERIKSHFIKIKEPGKRDFPLEEFYHSGALLMNIYGSGEQGKRWGECIVDCCREMRRNGKICENLDLGYWLMKTGKERHIKEMIRCGEQLIEGAMMNLVPQTMSLREKTNLMFYWRLSKKVRDQIEEEFFQEEFVRKLLIAEPVELEKNTVDSLWHKAFYCGLGEGVARLLLVRLFWSHFKVGENRSRIDCFFY